MHWGSLHRTLPLLAGIVIAVAVPVLSARDAGQARSAGGTRLIIRALTSDGQPVTDLKADEISIRTDGKDRRVKGLELVNAAAGAPAGPAAPTAPASKLPPPFATNTAIAATPPASGGREFLIVLDEGGIAAGREEPIRKAIAQLTSQGSAADRFGLASLRDGGVQVSPTSDRQAVTGAMARFVGGGSASESEGDMICRAKRTLGILSDTLRSSPTGRTIVLVSPGIPANPTGITTLGRRDVAKAELCQIMSTDLENLGIAANTSPANTYVLYYSEGLASESNRSAAQQGLENMAGVTSAEVVRLGGGNEATVGRILRETTSYYIATLEDAAPGPVRRIEGRVTRDGVKILARPDVAQSSGAATAASAKGMSPRDILRTTATFNEVPLRAAAFVSRQGAADMKVVTLFEPADPGVKLTAAAVGLVDEKGTLKSQWTAKPEELERSPVAAALPIAPGKYRVRVAAITAAGAAGTVDYDLRAALDDAGALKFATMLLGFTNEKAGFTPKLQFTSSDKVAVGLVEVYGVPKGANVTVQYELAEGDAAAPLGNAPGTVGPGAGDDARIAYGGFSIGTLQPGDYIMRATISVDGKVVGKATRTLRKVD